MSAIQSLSTAVSTLRSNPTILAVGFGFAILTQVASVLQLVDPSLSSLAGFAFLFVYPFVFGGLVGMVDGALDGRASLDRFFEEGQSNYASILGATLLLALGTGVVAFAFTILLTFLAAFVGALALSGGSAGFATGAGLALAAIALVGLLLFLFVAMFLQFVTEAIVIDGADAVGSFTESVELVRRNFAGVLGFSVLAFLVNLVLQLPSQAAYFSAIEFSFDPAEPTTIVADQTMFGVSIVLGVVLGTLAISLLWTYHVAYYRSIRDGAPGDTSDARAAV